MITKFSRTSVSAATRAVEAINWQVHALIFDPPHRGIVPGFVSERLADDRVGLIALGQRDRGRSQLRILVAAPRNIEQVELLSMNEPCRANRPIVLSAILGRGVPTLDDLAVCAVR